MCRVAVDSLTPPLSPLLPCRRESDHLAVDLPIPLLPMPAYPVAPVAPPQFLMCDFGIVI